MHSICVRQHLYTCVYVRWRERDRDSETERERVVVVPTLCPSGCVCV